VLEIPAQIWQKTKTSYIWRSLFRHGYPDSRKNQSLAVFTNVFLHLHPVKVRRHALAIPYTWCMGGLSFFLFLILTLTGTLLMFYYHPSVDGVYSADPKKDPSAHLLEQMRFETLVLLAGKGHRNAGPSVVFDPVAARVVARDRTPLNVVHGRDLPALRAAILGESFHGTRVTDE